MLGDVIEGGAIVRGEEWNKIIDHDLGVELAYPPDFGLTGERQGKNSLHIYRQIGYGERLHCNESGEPRPRALSDPDLYLSVEDRGFYEYLGDSGMYSLEDFVSLNGGEVKVFNDGRKYYEWVHGVEMCNSRTTIVPLDDGRLAIFDEPLIGDALEELLDGRKQFAYWDREAIFASIKSLATDLEKAKRNEVASEFEPEDDSTESRERAESLGITPREFHLKLGGRGDVNPLETRR